MKISRIYLSVCVCVRSEHAGPALIPLPPLPTESQWRCSSPSTPRHPTQRRGRCHTCPISLQQSLLGFGPRHHCASTHLHVSPTHLRQQKPLDKTFRETGREELAHSTLGGPPPTTVLLWPRRPPSTPSVPHVPVEPTGQEAKHAEAGDSLVHDKLN